MKTHRLALMIAATLVGIALMPLPAAAGEFCETSDGVATMPPSSTAVGNYALACGMGNAADGEFSTVVGNYNAASGHYSTAMGSANTATGFNSTALGADNTASGQYSQAVGNYNSAAGFDSSALGSINVADANYSQAVGNYNTAAGANSSALGSSNAAEADFSQAIGNYNTAAGVDSTAVGSSNVASAIYSQAFGSYNTVAGDESTAVGTSNLVNGTASAALGAANQVDSAMSTAIGYGNRVSGLRSHAFGADNLATGARSLVLGNNSHAIADDSLALGNDSIADRANTVSIGAPDAYRQLVNLAPGSEDNDAVNVAQMFPFANALGGGASFSGGVLFAPTYTIQGSDYNDVGSAFAAVDARLTTLGNDVGTPGPPGPQGPQGPTGPQGPAGPGGPDPDAVHYDDPGHAQITLDGADGTRIGNVADGVASSDAANLGQVEAGDATTLQSANNYTDQKFASINLDFGNLRTEINDRFEQQDRRIDKVGAMGAAMANMTASAAGVRTQNRVAIGVGNYRGANAFAFGYQRALSERAVITIGGAFNGDDSQVGAGAAFGW